MAENTSPETRKPSEPPGGGRQDHGVMRDAALRPLADGGGATTRAAGGGLDVPGREPGSTTPLSRAANEPESSLIPGERDASTLTHREAGAVSGQFAGADIPATPPATVDERTALEHAREGGGAEGEREFKSHRKP